IWTPVPVHPHHSAFLGKTVFVTGGSRGIGKAIALKIAKDGANVVIAAKTTEPHPKLEGTIFTAAKEGRCPGACPPRFHPPLSHTHFGLQWKAPVASVFQSSVICAMRAPSREPSSRPSNSLDRSTF